MKMIWLALVMGIFSFSLLLTGKPSFALLYNSFFFAIFSWIGYYEIKRDNKTGNGVKE